MLLFQGMEKRFVNYSLFQMMLLGLLNYLHIVIILP